MKQFYLSLFFGSFSLGLSAQTIKADTAKSKTTYTMKLPADLKYQLPDGKVITPDKLDSATATWGGRQFEMAHEEGAAFIK